MNFVSLVDCTDKRTGRWCCGSTSKDELHDPRGSLAKKYLRKAHTSTKLTHKNFYYDNFTSNN